MAQVTLHGLGKHEASCSALFLLPLIQFRRRLIPRMYSFPFNLPMSTLKMAGELIGPVFKVHVPLTFKSIAKTLLGSPPCCAGIAGEETSVERVLR
jgi:hypothetical protein